MPFSSRRSSSAASSSRRLIPLRRIRLEAPRRSARPAPPGSPAATDLSGGGGCSMRALQFLDRTLRVLGAGAARRACRRGSGRTRRCRRADRRLALAPARAPCIRPCRRSAPTIVVVTAATAGRATTSAATRRRRPRGPRCRSAERAMPKSMISASPSASIMMFAGFRSRWTTPAVCAATSPDDDRRARCAARVGTGSLPSRFRIVARSAPVDVRHRDVLDAVDLAEVVNADDVLVRDLAGEQQLALEAPLDFGRGMRGPP